MNEGKYLKLILSLGNENGMNPRTVAQQTDQKAKNSFCHSACVASALKRAITTVCMAEAYMP